MKKLFSAIAVILLFTTCKKTNTNPPAPPAPVIATLTTTAASAITSTTATSGGNISSDGGAGITARGVCWNTSVSPTIANSKTIDGTGTGAFASSVTGLTAGTIYYIRAYATNSAGTAYGNEITITAGAALATITTTAASAITATTATSGGNITNDGGSAITARGVCWNTSAGPTIADSKTIDGTGTGIFASSVTGLTAGTIYYIRAYATNSGGTAYGNEITITTGASLATITTTAASAITATTATSGGNITSDGGSAITARGVCWNTSAGPTIANSKTIDGTGTGIFASSVTGLTAGTVYYIRAYATNSAGTAYGNEITITTSATLATITTTAVSAITATTATSGGNITNDGGSTITARGVCWNTSAGPTIANSKTIDGTGTGIFASTVTGLTAGTIYYIRAYATNSGGTAYGNEIIFTTLSSIPSVTICGQIWMLNNLEVTTYRNGDPIPQVTDPSAWAGLTTGAWCYYNNNSANGPVYGKLYNWYAVNDPRGLAPTGWHVPSDAEWATLETCLGGTSVAGGAMKETGTIHWTSPNTGATNSSGFTALPGGYRYSNGTFLDIGNFGDWWSATESTPANALDRYVGYNASSISTSSYAKQGGASIRCIKD